MSRTEPMLTTTDKPSIRFMILNKLRGINNDDGNLYVGVRPFSRAVIENIVHVMKQYFIIKMPKDNFEDVNQLEKEYMVITAIGEHINLIRKEEYHAVHNIVYLALDFAIAKSLYHYLAAMGTREGAANTITRNNERWTRYLFRQFIAGL
jgi:hypothetical protein